MSAFASDAFAGTENDELSVYNALWAKVTGNTVAAEIASGRLRASAINSVAYLYSTAPAGADYSVFADVYGPTTVNGRAGVIGRASNSANTFYSARLNVIAGNLELRKTVAGTVTTLGSAAGSVGSGASKVIELRMAGTTIGMYWDGNATAISSVTDSAISAAGFAGVTFNHSTTPTDTSQVQLDNFTTNQAGAAASPAFRRAFPLPILNF